MAAIVMLLGLVQTILQILGWLGIIGGIIAMVVGNTSRGKELLIGGVLFIVLKYLLGFMFLGVAALAGKSPRSVSIPSNNYDDSKFNHLISLLNKVKHGSDTQERKLAFSKKLIAASELTQDQKQDLLDQMEQVYAEK